jgi:hypothetical protein
MLRGEVDYSIPRFGERDHTVAATARALGGGWHTIMRVVRELSAPVVDDPARIDPPDAPVRPVGVDETTFLATAPTQISDVA